MPKGLSGELSKSAQESLFVVHENGVGYSTKWMPVRYCQIAIFQGFGMAIPGLESGPENSARDGGKMTVSGCLSAAMNLRLGAILNLRLRAGVPTLAVGRQKVSLARLIIGNRPLKTVQRGGPKFHAFQILVQALKGFGKIAHDLVFRQFRHEIGPYLQSTFLFLER
jgi:hypothetical protein